MFIKTMEYFHSKGKLSPDFMLILDYDQHISNLDDPSRLSPSGSTIRIMMTESIIDKIDNI